ncbi:MAG: histidine phosphatase family protein, partial [Pseudonocardia sp.]|nr:histidine phosphatase family protein [Pseudonocardia sp.]
SRVSAQPASASWTGQTGRPTRLLLLRHGETEFSAQRRYSGRADPELTALGHAQAAAVAAGIGTLDGADQVSAVLSSPLRRARQTADPVAAALGLPVSDHDALVETDFGAWDGLTFAQARERDPDVHRRWLGDETVRPPGGESFADVAERVAALRDELVARHPSQTLLLVSHVTPIKLLLRLALDAGPSVLYRLHLDLASLSVAELYPDGGASVRLVNGRFPANP